MSENHLIQIYKNLVEKETEVLLEIWQQQDASKWIPEVFEMVREILEERLGHVPEQSIETQVLNILERVKLDLDKGNLQIALRDCEQAIQMEPGLAISYNLHGEIYYELGELENAIASYQRAIQINPGLKAAWQNMLWVESVLEEEFEVSSAKTHLDQALEYAYEKALVKALEEIELAKVTLPGIAIANNYIGLIFEVLEQLQPAIEYYVHALHLNPKFSPARENLGNARIRLEEQQYRHVSELAPPGDEPIENENGDAFDEYKMLEISENGDLIPQWLYMDEAAYQLRGWPGHRTRQGRSGYDPLDSDFENAHMQGIMIRRLITLNFRTQNPTYLLLMAFIGCVLCLPLLGVVELFYSNAGLIYVTIIYFPSWIVGAAVLINIISSLLVGPPDDAIEGGNKFY